MECRNQKVSFTRASRGPLFLVLGIAACITIFSLLGSLAQSERNAKAQKDDDIVTSARSAAILSQLRSMSKDEEDLSDTSDTFLSDLVNYTGLYEDGNLDFMNKPAETAPQAVEVQVAPAKPPEESEHDKAVRALRERRAEALLKALSATSAVDSNLKHTVGSASSPSIGGGQVAAPSYAGSSSAIGSYAGGQIASGGGYGHAANGYGGVVGPESAAYMNQASARLIALNRSHANATGGYSDGGAYSGNTMAAYDSLRFKGTQYDTSIDRQSVGPAGLTLMQGAVVPCVLLTGVNSDIPGMVQAQVSADVYDSATGRHVLIPKGSKLLGQYASGPMRGQERLMFGFNRLIFPNGRSMQLGAMPASARDGYAGLGANVNNRFFEILGNAILLGGVTAGIALSVDDNSRDEDGNLTVNGALSQGLGQSVGRVITQLIERNMNVSPTLTIKPGYEFNVTLSQDVSFAM